MVMMSAQLKKRKVYSHQTRSQRIAQLCELLKGFKARRARALLRSDPGALMYNGAIDQYTRLIHELHLPPYMKRK